MKTKEESMFNNFSIVMLFLITTIIISCTLDPNDEGIAYQGALYIADANGSNIQKVIDVGDVDYYNIGVVDVDYVKFIYNQNKLVYRKDNALYTVNFDGSDNTKISGDIDIKFGDSSVSVATDGNLMIFTGFENEQADLFVYDVDNESFVNVTETDSIDEFNPRFSTDNETACFITSIDSVHHLCVLDISSFSVDALYTNHLRIPGCVYSIDQERIYFIEEYEDSKQSIVSTREYYRGKLMSLDVSTLELIMLDDYTSNSRAHLMDINANYLLFRRYSSGDWVAFDLENQITILIELYAGFIELNENNQILHSGDSITGSIKLFDIETGTIDEILTDSFGGSYNLDETKICFVSRYRVN